MKSYVWLTFGFMGWAYYEMSGGSEFERVAVVETVIEDTAAPEIVARASTPTLQSLSTSNIAPQADAYDASMVVVSAPVIAELEPEVISVAAPAPEPVLDIRAVKGSRVNMRMGPGTGFDVITTLDGGTKLEILEVNADGWANVATVDRGIEGWMAERLLTAPET